MKVAQLITILQSLSQDCDIMVQGYEGGLCDINADKISLSKVLKNRNSSYWYGPHEEDTDDDEKYLREVEDYKGEATTAYIIYRNI